MQVRRRRWLEWLVVALAIGLWLWWAGASLWSVDADRVAIGMSREQVEALLGRQPIKTNSTRPEIWKAWDGDIVVYWGNDGKVASCISSPSDSWIAIVLRVWGLPHKVMR